MHVYVDEDDLFTDVRWGTSVNNSLRRNITANDMTFLSVSRISWVGPSDFVAEISARHFSRAPTTSKFLPTDFALYDIFLDISCNVYIVRFALHCTDSFALDCTDLGELPKSNKISILRYEGRYEHMSMLFWSYVRYNANGSDGAGYVLIVNVIAACFFFFIGSFILTVLKIYTANTGSYYTRIHVEFSETLLKL